jgi:hypothetical protein
MSRHTPLFPLDQTRRSRTQRPAQSNVSTPSRRTPTGLHLSSHGRTACALDSAAEVVGSPGDVRIVTTAILEPRLWKCAWASRDRSHANVERLLGGRR